MSRLSQNLLKSDHNGVHQQFDFVYTATLAFTSLFSSGILEQSLRTHHKKIIKKEIKDKMWEIKFKPGFMGSGLVFYAYEFLELLVSNSLGESPTEEDLKSYFDGFLEEMAEYLDDQFQREGRADSVGFLKLKI